MYFYIQILCFWTLEFSAEQQRRCSEIIRGIFNRPLASGRTNGYLVRLRCSIKAAGECQVGAEKRVVITRLWARGAGETDWLSAGGPLTFKPAFSESVLSD